MRTKLEIDWNTVLPWLHFQDEKDDDRVEDLGDDDGCDDEGEYCDAVVVDVHDSHWDDDAPQIGLFCPCYCVDKTIQEMMAEKEGNERNRIELLVPFSRND